MVAILSAVALIFVFRFRNRAALELKLIALQHQLAVLRRQRPGRPQLSSLDRLLWVLLYRLWPQVIDAMVLVKPATVVEWHRWGFRLYWRWRSRDPGRPKISPDIRDLIRQMSRANPLWGAPRIHGELLKLGINVSQAPVGRWMPWRPKVPSPTWRSFLGNHLEVLDVLVQNKRDKRVALRLMRKFLKKMRYGAAARVLGSLLAINAGGGATTERRTRINLFRVGVGALTIASFE